MEHCCINHLEQFGLYGKIPYIISTNAGSAHLKIMAAQKAASDMSIGSKGSHSSRGYHGSSPFQCSLYITCINVGRRKLYGNMLLDNVRKYFNVVALNCSEVNEYGKKKFEIQSL